MGTDENESGLSAFTLAGRCDVRNVVWLVPTVFALCVVVGCDAQRGVTPVSLRRETPKPAAMDKAIPDKLSMVSAENDGSGSSVNVMQPDDWFQDITESAGLDTTYRTGRSGENYFILESLGGGVACMDYDLDGNVDLAFSGGGAISKAQPQARITGLPNSLFRNATYRSEAASIVRFHDVTQFTGLNSPADYSHGLFVADFNVDGFSDVLVTAFGTCRLYVNCGDGTFEQCRSDTLGTESRWWTGAAWGDVDRDGLPDLFLTGYLDWKPEIDRPCFNADGNREVCGPRSFASADDRLLRNSGEGEFEDISANVGLRSGGNGLAVLSADINGDALTDFYVANDETDNFLYLGQPDGTLQEVAHAAGVAVNQYGMHDGSMGLDLGDYDRDGRQDLWVTNFEMEDNCLYRNLGDHLFQQTTNTAGLAGRSRLHVGFGTAMEDFNQDGWLDLFVTNGHVFYGGGQLPWQQFSQLFSNTANGRFTEVSRAGGTYFRSSHAGRGTAVGDVNNDGAADMIITHQDAPPSLLLNRISPSSSLSLRLIGTHGNRDAFGASVSVETLDGIISRPVRSGAGYLSSFDSRVLIAIPSPMPQTQSALSSDSPDESLSSTGGQHSSEHSLSADVTVRWAGSGREIFRSVRFGQTEYLVQGRGVPDAAP